MEKIENGGQVNAVSTDIRKVFDNVNFDLLLYKLKVLGMSDP